MKKRPHIPPYPYAKSRYVESPHANLALNMPPPSSTNALANDLVAKQPACIDAIPRFAIAVSSNLAAPAYEHRIENAA